MNERDEPIEQEEDQESFAESLALAAEARALVANPKTLIQSTYVGLSVVRQKPTGR